MNLAAKIEAILFWKGESLSILELSKILKVNKEEIENAILDLKENLSNRGIVLQEKDGEYMLSTTGEISDLIEDLQKEELNKDLSKSSLETLSIILYKNGASRSEIDYIRGVNSSFILRALSVRGLVEKITDPKDSRKYIYRPTFELLSFMGISSVKDLPDYNEISVNVDNEVKELENQND